MIDTDKYEKLIESIVISEEEYIDGSDNLLEDSQRLKACAITLLAEVIRLREGRLDLINEVVRIINNKTGERVDADLHDYIIDRLVNE